MFVQFLLALAVLLVLTQAFQAKAPLSSRLSLLKGSGHDDPYKVLRNPTKNKGASFTPKERDEKHLRGLVPAGVPIPLDVKVHNALTYLRTLPTPLSKYIYLHSIQDTDETLFYSLVINHLAEIMPLVYTPTVGEACKEWSKIYKGQSRGLYLSIEDTPHIKDILTRIHNNNPNIKVIVVTDGERILGLGDLGAGGMGISIGKLALYVGCAGIRPEQCLPVTLDVGTNTHAVLHDPSYIGVRTARERGPKYDQLVEGFMKTAQEVFGRNVLIQFEDFGNTNAFRILDTYRNQATCFNDDIQGTASVVLAGVMAALPLNHKKKLSDHTYLFYGAGEAGVGIGDLLSEAMAAEGLTLEQAKQKCWFVDSKGLITADRLSTPLEHHKLAYAHDKTLLPGYNEKEHHRVGHSLLDAINLVRPTAIIGVSAQGGTFTPEVLRTMTSMNSPSAPLVMALSNPTSKAECTAEDCYVHTQGKAVFASGSPFDPVTLQDGTKKVPGQGNNAYIFPGVGLGALAAEATSITDEDFMVAAKTLAGMVSKDRLSQGCIYPPLSHIREVSKAISIAVAKGIVKDGRSSLTNPPASDQAWATRLDEMMYVPKY
eukprot:gene22956-27936_t